MSKNFYRAFEEKFRGSEALIRSRLEAYLPFILPLLHIYPHEKVIDIGCGRGEWLALLKDYGFDALGVDIDKEMLRNCQEKGLNTVCSDGFAYLARLPDSSQIIVSAFHVVEHIPFEQLQQFITDALRVLKPGGLLIMETPNPDNMRVATYNFYLDPTHIRPIPSQLLSFVAEYAGFFRVKTLGLQEESALKYKNQVSVRDVLYGVSPDYAVIAQKKATDEVMMVFDEVFAREYGVSQEHLLQKLDVVLGWVGEKYISSQKFKHTRFGKFVWWIKNLFGTKKKL